MAMLSKKRKLVLITGSAKRLGAEMALSFARLDYDVIIHFNNSLEEAKSVVKKIENMGCKAIMIRANLNDELKNFIETVKNSELIKNRGGLDLLINSASKYEKMDFENVTEELWDEMQGINTKAPFFLTQGLIDEIRNVNGSIINMVDTSYNRPWKYYTNYCSSKASLYNMTLSLSHELAPEIRVNGIAPGAIMFPDWIEEKDKQEILDQIPMIREGTAEEIAATAVFLAEGPEYITGQIISVDGGLNL
ncbi:MAG: hypothetical protein CMB56_002255 [Methanobacteriota archaeon]|nr:MAG: hypothetical protein CMB56_002255 [Euryarchaeota archaeon]|tara:strand:+ start:3862 stop:4608 length:747 start_codon:yes stop_codon:yes gene_type:complete